MSDENNGPAFPVSTLDGFTNTGMTLRQYYAAKAMQAWFSHPTRACDLDAIVKEIFAVADAMITFEQGES